MTDPTENLPGNNPLEFRAKRLRLVEPTERNFPYPPDLTPRGNFGVYLSEGMLGELFYLACQGNVRDEHFGLIMGGTIEILVGL